MLTNYCLRYFNIGKKGQANDAAVFTKSSLNSSLEDVENRLNIPKSGALVADDAFSLKIYILEPFGRSFNLLRIQQNLHYYSGF